MSYARNQNRKARRRELDAANPERRRIRRMIRNGEQLGADWASTSKPCLPRYKVQRVVRRTNLTTLKNNFHGVPEQVVVKSLKRTDLVLKSAFVLLTATEAKGAA